MKPAFYSVGNGGSFPRGKVTGVWSWPPASNTEVKNKRSYTFASPMCLCGMHRDCFSYYILFLQRFYLVHFHTLISLFQIKSNKCTHINTTLLTLYHSNMVQSSKSHSQEVQLINFKSKINKMSCQ